MRECVKTHVFGMFYNNSSFLMITSFYNITASFSPLDSVINNRFTGSMRNNCGIISSNVLDYQAILEHTFIDFLTAGGASEKTRNNYRSDLRHFIGWTMLTIVSRNYPTPQTHVDFVQLISADLLQNYKLYLLENRIPAATINRRLSTIRMFIRAAIEEGWIVQNPALTLSNVAEPKHDTIRDILTHWQHDLEAEGASKSTIKNYLTDVRKFLEWNSHPQSVFKP